MAAPIKKLALLRMRMMPYWYSEFAKYHYKGTPVFRGMSLEPGFENTRHMTVKGNLEDNPYLEAVSKEVKDQYMAGAYLLVAPLFAGEASRKVILPKGKWYDFYTGAYVGDGEIITVTPGLDKIPVYVKNGGIIPMMPAMLHAPKKGQRVDLEIRVYGDKAGTYQLYDDDGVSLDYEKGAFDWRSITVFKNKNGNLEGSVEPPHNKSVQTYNRITFRFMTEQTSGPLQ